MTFLHLNWKRFHLVKEGIGLFLIFSAITIAFDAGYYLPSKREINGLKGEVEKLEGRVAGYQAAQAASGKDYKRLQELLRTYEGMEVSLLLGKEQIPPAKEVSNVLKEISSPRPGLTLLSLQASPVEDKGECLRLPLVLQFRGTFPSFGAYIVSLENSGRLISVENIKLVKENSAGLLIRMDISTYLMKDGAV